MTATDPTTIRLVAPDPDRPVSEAIAAADAGREDSSGGAGAGGSRPRTELLAGGTDLIPLQHHGLIAPDTIVDLKRSALSAAIERRPGGWYLGALTTLTDLEEHPDLGRTIPAIPRALAQVATRQVRNRATVGGNLLQRPRCSYFRDAAVDCLLTGGDTCPARTGRNEHHAVVDTGPCVAVQPSDLASVLVALGASVVTTTRTVPVADFLRSPGPDRPALHDLGPGEVVTAVTIPDGDHLRSTYLKAMDRAAWQFALVGVAARVELDARGTVTAAALVGSGLAATPHRLDDGVDALVGRSLADPPTREAAAEAAATGLTPLDGNAYKVPLVRGLTRRALDELAEAVPT